ncbi:MAG: ankyrin repeat domain-containing protein [Planctomycetes bacterium]|nr:ankyrin repeat domain-containing protein [Planctomycetota bacterium]
MSLEKMPLYRILDTRYDAGREQEAIDLLNQYPELAKQKWEEAVENEQVFIVGRTVLHYAANDGKIKLMTLLIEYGADVNAAEAHWYATPLSWAANNAQVEALQLLLDHGAEITSLHAMHAVACGGSSRGKNNPDAYVKAAKLLLDHGADIDDRREPNGLTPYQTALSSGNTWVAEFLKSLGAE